MLGGVQSFVRTENQSMLEVTFDRSLAFRWRYGNALSFCFLLFGRIDCDLPLFENRVYWLCVGSTGGTDDIYGARLVT